MIDFIESQTSLEKLQHSLYSNESTWFFMWRDINKHPLNNTLSFICIQINDVLKVVGIDHVDLHCFDLEEVEPLFNTIGPKKVFDKKKVMHAVDLKGTVHDIESFHYLNAGHDTNFMEKFDVYQNVMYSRTIKEDYVSSLPLMKLLEHIADIIKQYSEIDTTLFGYEWVNETYIPVLNKLEQRGLQIHTELFTGNDMHINNNRVYTEYNPYTATGRPSNRHGGVNYAALSKKDGSREMIHSGENVFIQFDFDAYHPRIIGDLIGFDIPHTSGHQWLGDQYGVDYDESKSITFRQIYGGVEDKYKHIDFLSEIDKFIQIHWEAIQDEGYIETYHRRILLDWIDNINPQKAFNYLLQAIETERNIDLLSKIFEIIEGTNIYCILYTYDSFLFEVPLDVNKQTMNQIKNTLEQDKFPVKYSYGTSYQQL